MEVDYLVVADAVTVAEGKHYIHGAGWDSLYATNYPVTHPSLGIAVRLKVPWNATSHPHRIELDVLDADGMSLLPDPPGSMQGEINVGRPSNLRAGADQYVCLAFNLIGLGFREPGEYVVQLRLDGLDVKRTTLTVIPPPGIQAQIA